MQAISSRQNGRRSPITTHSVPGLSFTKVAHVFNYPAPYRVESQIYISYVRGNVGVADKLAAVY